MPNDTRAHKRKEFQETPWTFALFLQEQQAPQDPFRLEAKNISLGGLKFLCNRKIPLFETLQVHLFDQKEKGEPIKLMAKVIRVEEIDIGLAEKTYGLAAKFDSLPDRFLPALEKVLGENEEIN